jgi:hypothetical protein
MELPLHPGPLFIFAFIILSGLNSEKIQNAEELDFTS